MPKIIIENQNRIIEYSPSIRLLINLKMQNVPIGSVCGGRGNCGTCRYLVLEGGKFITPINKIERFRLTEEELAKGWRLACQTYALRDLKIFIPEIGTIKPAS